MTRNKYVHTRVTSYSSTYLRSEWLDLSSTGIFKKSGKTGNLFKTIKICFYIENFPANTPKLNLMGCRVRKWFHKENVGIEILRQVPTLQRGAATFPTSKPSYLMSKAAFLSFAKLWPLFIVNNVINVIHNCFEKVKNHHSHYMSKADRQLC